MAADKTRHLAVVAPTAEEVANVADAPTVHAVEFADDGLAAGRVSELLCINHRVTAAVVLTVVAL